MWPEVDEELELMSAKYFNIYWCGYRFGKTFFTFYFLLKEQDMARIFESLKHKKKWTDDINRMWRKNSVDFMWKTSTQAYCVAEVYCDEQHANQLAPAYPVYTPVTYSRDDQGWSSLFLKR